MRRIGPWWARQRWGPLAATSEYRRERVVGLLEGSEVHRPTDDEWRLAATYLSWVRRQWRWSLATVLATVVIALSLAAIARFAWNLVWIMLVTAGLQRWRVGRWQSRFDRLQPVHDKPE